MISRPTIPSILSVHLTSLAASAPSLILDGVLLDRGLMNANAAFRRVMGVISDGGMIESSFGIGTCVCVCMSSGKSRRKLE